MSDLAVPEKLIIADFSRAEQIVSVSALIAIGFLTS